MTIRDEIIAIANQIANKGKKPSVALIKNKLSHTAPLPLIISTLKNWQHEPENINIPVPCSEQEAQTESPLLTLEQLEQQLAPLRADIHEIKLLLKALVSAKET